MWADGRELEALPAEVQVMSAELNPLYFWSLVWLGSGNVLLLTSHS